MQRADLPSSADFGSVDLWTGAIECKKIEN
jgi:hypothetical protein